MRIGVWVASAFVGLLLASPCWAQAVTFGHVNPTQIVNTPVITSSSTSAITPPQQTPNTGSSLFDFFPRFALPGPKPVHGQSMFPTPDKMPGKDYLKAFGYQRGVPIAP
jgi:hypothetical protein